jgi:hypothetical protein
MGIEGNGRTCSPVKESPNDPFVPNFYPCFIPSCSAHSEREESPSASGPLIQRSTFTVHSPLLQALKNFNQLNLPAGTRLFHGCREMSQDTDRAQQSLRGNRKWFSQSAVYAADYSFYNSGDLGARLLWVCELSATVPSLEGSQRSLVDFSPCDMNFPSEFPNAFEDYAKTILPGTGPRALLDHLIDGIYHEILLTMPSVAVRVVEIIELPNDRDQARRISRDRFCC